ncbi:hypothetical protein JCM10207_007446 [Rhodosporidiobolus poonsookiae]
MSNLSESSRASKRHRSTRKTARSLLNGPFHPWDFSQKVKGILASGGEESMWVEAAKPLYELATNKDYLHYCAITGSTDSKSLQCAHIVGAADGVEEFFAMRDLQIVPDAATHHWPCNKVYLSHLLHTAMDAPNPSFRLLPTLNDVLVRLTAEVSYREARRLDSTLPLRPLFEAFLERFEAASPAVQPVWSDLNESSSIERQVYQPHPTDPERPGTFYKSLYRTRSTRDTDLQFSTTLPRFPPVLLPISLNLLIWSSWPRLRLMPPCPPDLVVQSEGVALAWTALCLLWRSDDPLYDQAVNRALRAVTLHLEETEPHNPFLAALLHPDPTSYHTLAPLPPPSDAVDARGTKISNPSATEHLSAGVLDSGKGAVGSPTAVSEADSSFEDDALLPFTPSASLKDMRVEREVSMLGDETDGAQAL